MTSIPPRLGRGYNGGMSKFHIEFHANGASVVANAGWLTPGCLSDAEVDREIGALKTEIEGLAIQMKRQIALEAKRPPFEKPNA